MISQHILFEYIIIILMLSIASAIIGTIFLLAKKTELITNISQLLLFGFAINALFMMLTKVSFIRCINILLILGVMYVIFKLSTKWSLKERNLCLLLSYSALSLGFLILFHSHNIMRMDHIIFGNLVDMSFDRIIISHVDLGSFEFYNTIAALIFDVCCIVYYYKDIKILLIDKIYAQTRDIDIKRINIIIILMIIITLPPVCMYTGVFMAPVLFLLPAATAIFYSKRLSATMITSIVINFIAFLIGYTVAHAQNFYILVLLVTN